MLRFWLFVLAFFLSTPAMAQQGARRVALVVGIGSYERLPATLARETARTDAASVAAALEKAGFDRVRLLTDASATTANVRAVLKEQLAREVGPQDLFLLYFVGHGMGADFGEPRLLAYDTDPDDVEKTSFAAADLAKNIREWVPAGRFVLVTDAAFEGQLAGLALLGPTGNDWPSMGSHSFVMSSAAPRQTARPGAFARAFIDGVGGRADANGDGAVTASELNGYLVVSVPELTAGKQLPTVQGTYDPALEITRRPAAPVSVLAITADPAMAAPVARIDKAKFVFDGGSAARVQCPAGPVTSCDPTCYLWDVPAGACTVNMYVEGRELAGSVDLLRRGAYACRVVEGALACTPPSAP
ncbi:MAG: caspase family protein [Myxococcota bacterium]